MTIMTGAPMPAGADTVVRVEDSERLDDVVKVLVAVETATSVRLAGSDIPEGATVFGKGERIHETHLGVLATVGAARPSVSRRPRVALFSTGDELAAPSTAALRRGPIRDSNRLGFRRPSGRPRGRMRLSPRVGCRWGITTTCAGSWATWARSTFGR